MILQRVYNQGLANIAGGKEYVNVSRYQDSLHEERNREHGETTLMEHALNPVSGRLQLFYHPLWNQ
jgi:hypothetical protein